MRISLLFLLMFFETFVGKASAQRPTIEDFTMSGDTYLTDDDCFRLTDELDYSSGSIWYRKPISLTSVRMGWYLPLPRVPTG